MNNAFLLRQAVPLHKAPRCARGLVCVTLCLLAVSASAQELTTLRPVRVPQSTPLVVVMPSSNKSNAGFQQELVLAQDFVYDGVLLLKAGSSVPFQLESTPVERGKGGSLILYVNTTVGTEHGEQIPVGGVHFVKGAAFSTESTCFDPFCLASLGVLMALPGLPARFGRGLLLNLYVQQDVVLKGSEAKIVSGSGPRTLGRIHLYSEFATKLKLDGKTLGKIHKRSYFCVAVSHGEHSLQVSAADLKFNVEGGEERYFKITPSEKGYRVEETPGYELESPLNELVLGADIAVNCFSASAP
jgi:hypothetical protein